MILDDTNSNILLLETSKHLQVRLYKKQWIIKAGRKGQAFWDTCEVIRLYLLCLKAAPTPFPRCSCIVVAPRQWTDLLHVLVGRKRRGSYWVGGRLQANTSSSWQERRKVGDAFLPFFAARFSYRHIQRILPTTAIEISIDLWIVNEIHMVGWGTDSQKQF